MTTIAPAFSGATPFQWMRDALDYAQDVYQRNTLFMDTLRRRGNQYLDHLRKGQPPVLAFAYDVLLDGRELDPPTNYYLARIRDRRSCATPPVPRSDEKRHAVAVKTGSEDPERPIIIIDPRAGHGPGIGGAKRDSEIGMALDQGHPVYVILFHTWPVPGQTLDHVQRAMMRFVEVVRERHPLAGNPAIIGNCQAGWATALLGAVRPDITGPMVLNGAPLSYWAGVKGKNPMRYKGGLAGGVWLATLWSDLGNGIFDGAHLVAGFEDLNPANTLWDKQYHLWANVDAEEDRYLEFERWWNGYFMLTAEEIHFIIDELFVGNHAQRGRLVMNDRLVDLKSLKGPIVVFASHGDNITPPQQALNWIPAQWGSVDEIRRRQQVIVYMVHGTIGHLGIFVSAAVSKKEHREIIASIDLMHHLSPGLYEMIISDGNTQGIRHVRFEPREMADILALDDDDADEAAFTAVAALSRFNDRLYRLTLRPWVNAWMTESTAELLRQLHPMRMTRYGFSDLNPWMGYVKSLAENTARQRRSVSPDNPFLAMQNLLADAISQGINLYRDLRDKAMESWFYTLFDNPWVSALSAIEASEDTVDDPRRQDTEIPVEAGGFAEAVIRIMLALAHTGGATRRRSLAAFASLAELDHRLAHVRGDTLGRMIKAQSRIVQSAPEAALATLPCMLQEPVDRKKAMAIVREVVSDQDPKIDHMRKTIAAILGVD